MTLGWPYRKKQRKYVNMLLCNVYGYIIITICILSDGRYVYIITSTTYAIWS